MSGPLLIFIAAVLWGLDGVLRRSLFELPPITIVFLEHCIGLIIIAPFLIASFKKETLTTREWGALLLVSLLSGVLGTLFFTAALLSVGFIAFSVVFLIQKLQPIFAVLTASFVLREKPSKAYFVYACIALVAGYFVTFPNGVVNVDDGGKTATAAFLALLAAVAWGSSTAFSRYALLSHSHTFITGLRFLCTTLFAGVLLVLLGSAPSLALVGGDHLLTLAFIALSTGMLALWVYYKGLKSTPASVAAIVELAFPLTAVLIDYALYGTVLLFSQYLAAAILLFAMYNVAKLSDMKKLSDEAR
jgi:drug/metabolite transporter (DMT)-like permease